MFTLEDLTRFFAEFHRSSAKENYFYIVFMVIIQSKMSLQKLLSIKISDLDSNLFKMRYHRVDARFFQLLKLYSRESGSVFLLRYRSRFTYHKFIQKINKRAGTHITINDFRNIRL